MCEAYGIANENRVLFKSGLNSIVQEIADWIRREQQTPSETLTISSWAGLKNSLKALSKN